MPSIERRSGGTASRIRRAAWGWIMDTDLRTLEKLWITLQVALAFAVLVIQMHFTQERPLTLPGWAWSCLLLLGVIWQATGGAIKNQLARLQGAVASFTICCLLFGPLYQRGAALAVIVIPFTLWQATAIYRFYRATEARQECG